MSEEIKPARQITFEQRWLNSPFPAGSVKLKGKPKCKRTMLNRIACVFFGAKPEYEVTYEFEVKAP